MINDFPKSFPQYIEKRIEQSNSKIELWNRAFLQKKLTTFSRCYFRSVFLQNCKTLHSISDVQLDSEYAANIHVGLFFRNVLFFILNL